MTRSTAPCLLAAALLVLTGCGGASESASPEQATHTMSDGTVMDGESHAGHESEEGEDHHGATDGGTGPSPAAEMVCAGQVVDDVNRIMATSSTVTPTSGWEEPMFTCNFALEDGPVVLTVHDARAEDVGMAHFRDQRTEAADASPIKGVPSLGLPAFETPAGTVAFVRDGKTLTVDATGLRGRGFGVEGDQSRTEVAYAMAASVLACWTEHA